MHCCKKCPESHHQDQKFCAQPCWNQSTSPSLKAGKNGAAIFNLRHRVLFHIFFFDFLVLQFPIYFLSNFVVHGREPLMIMFQTIGVNGQNKKQGSQNLGRFWIWLLTWIDAFFVRGTLPPISWPAAIILVRTVALSFQIYFSAADGHVSNNRC